MSNNLPKVKPSRFVILTVPRTGSKLLAEMLDSHPDILCHTEVFNPNSTYLSRKPHLAIGTKEERDRNAFAFLDKLYMENDGASIVGFKLMPFHNNWVLWKLARDRSVRKIVLTRRNWLQAFISNQIVHTTKNYHVPISAISGNLEDNEESHPIVVSIPAFMAYQRKARFYFFVIRVIEIMSAQQFLWVDYSEIKDLQTTTRLLDFLEVEPNVPLEERLTKQNTSSLNQKLSNYGEVSAALQGTRWEWYLDENPPNR